MENLDRIPISVGWSAPGYPVDRVYGEGFTQAIRGMLRQRAMEGPPPKEPIQQFTVEASAHVLNRYVVKALCNAPGYQCRELYSFSFDIQYAADGSVLFREVHTRGDWRSASAWRSVFRRGVK